MMQTILGKEKFRKGMDLYFSRYDGQAVTCDDFVATMKKHPGPISNSLSCGTVRQHTAR